MKSKIFNIETNGRTVRLAYLSAWAKEAERKESKYETMRTKWVNVIE